MSDVVGYVAMGANVGDREANLRAGLAGMADLGIAPTRRSSIWETEPVGTREPHWFLNMVVEIRSSWTPLEVLERLLEVERRVGRNGVAIMLGVRGAVRGRHLAGRARLGYCRRRFPKRAPARGAKASVHRDVRGALGTTRHGRVSIS